MKNLSLVLIAAMLCSLPAHACSIFIPPAEQKFGESQVVVLAYPKAMSFQPAKADSRKFRGSFRQTVLWEVLVSWKGPYRAGQRFTTRDLYDTEEPCPRSPVYRHTQLLYLSGSEPYAGFYFSHPSYATDDFRYLETVSQAPKDGT